MTFPTGTAWREQGLLAVSIDDHRLTWPEREFVRQLGERLHLEKAALGAPACLKRFLCERRPASRM